jgi:hypothetical protein
MDIGVVSHGCSDRGLHHHLRLEGSRRRYHHVFRQLSHIESSIVHVFYVTLDFVKLLIVENSMTVVVLVIILVVICSPSTFVGVALTSEGSEFRGCEVS